MLSSVPATTSSSPGSTADVGLGERSADHLRGLRPDQFELGTLSILGALAIIVGGIGWYMAYGRSRTDRVGALSALLNRDGEEISDSEIEPS